MYIHTYIVHTCIMFAYICKLNKLMGSLAKESMTSCIKTYAYTS